MKNSSRTNRRLAAVRHTETPNSELRPEDITDERVLAYLNAHEDRVVNLTYDLRACAALMTAVVSACSNKEVDHNARLEMYPVDPGHARAHFQSGLDLLWTLFEAKATEIEETVSEHGTIEARDARERSKAAKLAGGIEIGKRIGGSR